MDEYENCCWSDYSRCLYQILSTRPLLWNRSGGCPDSVTMAEVQNLHGSGPGVEAGEGGPGPVNECNRDFSPIETIACQLAAGIASGLPTNLE